MLSPSQPDTSVENYDNMIVFVSTLGCLLCGNNKQDTWTENEITIFSLPL